MSENPAEKEMTEEQLAAREAIFRRRLEQLEREGRRLRRTSAALLVGLAVLLGLAVTVLVLFAQQRLPLPGETVQARSFVLRDAEGQMRALLGFTEEGGTQLALHDAQGAPRVRLSVLADGSPGLALVDAEGQSRAALGLLTDETVTLVFADRQGRSRAVLGLTAREASSVVFADRNGITRAGIGVAADGRATFTMDQSR